MKRTIVGGVAIVVAICCAICAAAQAPASAATAHPLKASVSKRTPLGQPSLEGMWSANFLINFEAEKDAPTLTLPEPEAKALVAARIKKTVAFFDRFLDPEIPAVLPTVDGLPIVRGERRTRMVTAPADGRLPYTTAARKELDGPPPKESFDNPEDRPNSERCLVGDSQPPFTTFVFEDQLQIVQTRDHVVLHSEYGGDMRVIPFTNKHRPAIFRDRLGDSIARWDGDTLVIETIGLPDLDRDRFYPVILVSGEATVVERLTRVSAKEMLYQFTVIDPKVYAAPWSAEFSWYATDKQMFEHACHEGNYSLPGILAGARREESLKAAKGVASR